MATVLFRRSSSPYNVGELAGFPLKEAQKLVNAGIASFYQATVHTQHPEEEASQPPAVIVTPDQVIETLDPTQVPMDQQITSTPKVFRRKKP
jgi:hypothetical protein